jgi:rhamnose utilization protein RhaD (predicted bifunctional aldolase and dehydrogenase)
MATKFSCVTYLWDDTVADKLDPVERLVYRSNIPGTDRRITNTGGGNTSAKITDKTTGQVLAVDGGLHEAFLR